MAKTASRCVRAPGVRTRGSRMQRRPPVHERLLFSAFAMSSRTTSSRVSFAAVTPNNLGRSPIHRKGPIVVDLRCRDRAETQLRSLPHKIQREVLQ